MVLMHTEHMLQVLHQQVILLLAFLLYAKHMITKLFLRHQIKLMLKDGQKIVWTILAISGNMELELLI
jgi:hypothetical protein